MDTDLGMVDIRKRGTMTPETKRITMTDIGYWMGQVDGKLENLDMKVGDIVECLDKIDCWQKEHMKEKDNPGKKDDIEERAVTWKWVVVTFVAPVITAALTALALWLMLGK